MANGGDDRRRHFLLEEFGVAERFTSPKTGRGGFDVPSRNRRHHAAVLRRHLRIAQRLQDRALAGDDSPEVPGLVLEFRGFSGIQYATESLARDNSGIELLNVREVGNAIYATVFVPDGKLHLFENRLTAYLERRLKANGEANDHRRLIDAIRSIRLATVRALWTDDTAILPENVNQTIAWEVWLPIRDSREGVLAAFREHATAAGWELSPWIARFAERTVIVCRGTQAQLEGSISMLTHVAELRRAKTTAEFFQALPPIEQQEWTADLLRRMRFPQGEFPSVCIIDTGVTRGHPLLQRSLDAADLHVVEPGWTTADEHGHGTEMAGLALIGDLSAALESDGPVEIFSKLESAKIIRDDGDNEGQPYGALTQEAVGRVEVTDPNRKRVFNLAVSASDTRDRGRPTSWSSTIDSLASDWQLNGSNPRLFIIAAGNSANSLAWSTHPDHLATQAIEDPAQAWNALTVGASTTKTAITEADAEGYQAIAQPGSLSPFSSSSVQWHPKMQPWKPDVVFEGGNAGKDAANFASEFASLSLLTTAHQPLVQLFTTANATSAATAQVSRIAAIIAATYPRLWPESLRALIVQSARWTPQMLAEFRVGATPTAEKRNLLRYCGYGVPDVERALWSAGNSLTLIVQDELQPFEKLTGGVKTCEMHVHDLPWPKDALEALGETEVTLRVTLSYFIEPNPSARGQGEKYVYNSHGLRFEVRRPDETTRNFKARINRLARDEEGGTTTGSSDDGWEIGDQLRRRGSIHSDTWRGSAVELANRGLLAVYPASGWWRNRARLGRHGRRARYSLIAAIETPATDVDLYNIVAALVAAEITT